MKPNKVTRPSGFKRVPADDHVFHVNGVSTGGLVARDRPRHRRGPVAAGEALDRGIEATRVIEFFDKNLTSRKRQPLASAEAARPLSVYRTASARGKREPAQMRRPR